MIKLYNGDCLFESDKIESGSVDLIITDLPYGTIKGMNDSGGYSSKSLDWDNVIDTKKIMDIANRILRKNGKMLLFAQDPFSTELKINKNVNIPYSYSMIWKKNKFANALSAKKACVKYHEDILLFNKKYDTSLTNPLINYSKLLFSFIGISKKELNVHFNCSLSKFYQYNGAQFNLCTEKSYSKLIDLYNIDKMDGFIEYKKLKEIYNKLYPSIFNLQGKKHKSTIFEYKKDNNNYHPTQKPILLLEDLIKTFSNENNLVVDLTMGSGSTGVACVNTNRNFIGIELDKDFYNIAVKRINKVDI
jgi:site-specific DNA-methyltransferase (adenine-specific)